LGENAARSYINAAQNLNTNVYLKCNVTKLKSRAKYKNRECNLLRRSVENV
jgi:hypothetical protein